jgi:hypothetical protein
MRSGLLVIGILACIGLAHVLLAGAYRDAIDAALTEDARVAIEVRCQSRQERAARQCRRTLKKLYLAGALDPDKTLRAYCDSVRDSQWGGGHPPPPEVCVRRYGGWRES